MALSYKKLEHNTNVSYMGKLRQHLHFPDALVGNPVSRGPFNASPHFCTQVKMSRLTRFETSPQPEAGIESSSHINMDNIMRCPSQANKEEVETEVIPYFFIHALNLGKEPPRRQRPSLALFTDPWRRNV
ncbi:hypothetical protein BsWGS_02659 [Bradybaena similaris]